MSILEVKKIRPTLIFNSSKVSIDNSDFLNELKEAFLVDKGSLTVNKGSIIISENKYTFILNDTVIGLILGDKVTSNNFSYMKRVLDFLTNYEVVETENGKIIIETELNKDIHADIKVLNTISGIKQDLKLEQKINSVGLKFDVTNGDWNYQLEVLPKENDEKMSYLFNLEAMYTQSIQIDSLIEIIQAQYDFLSNDFAKKIIEF